MHHAYGEGERAREGTERGDKKKGGAFSDKNVYIYVSMPWKKCILLFAFLSRRSDSASLPLSFAEEKKTSFDFRA